MAPTSTRSRPSSCAISRASRNCITTDSDESSPRITRTSSARIRRFTLNSFAMFALPATRGVLPPNYASTNQARSGDLRVLISSVNLIELQIYQPRSRFSIGSPNESSTACHTYYGLRSVLRQVMAMLRLQSVSIEIRARITVSDDSIESWGRAFSSK